MNDRRVNPDTMHPYNKQREKPNIQCTGRCCDHARLLLVARIAIGSASVESARNRSASDFCVRRQQPS